MIRFILVTLALLVLAYFIILGYGFVSAVMLGLIP
jgi:hypothetical protein